MEKNNNKNLEEILSSLDGTKRAPVPDFFYTRLEARMQRELEPANTRSWILRPAFAFTVLVAVLLLNALVIFRGNTTKEVATSDSETLQSIAAEYSPNDNSYVYDLNQDK